MALTASYTAPCTIARWSAETGGGLTGAGNRRGGGVDQRVHGVEVPVTYHPGVVVSGPLRTHLRAPAIGVRRRTQRGKRGQPAGRRVVPSSPPPFAVQLLGVDVGCHAAEHTASDLTGLRPPTTDRLNVLCEKPGSRSGGLDREHRAARRWVSITTPRATLTSSGTAGIRRRRPSTRTIRTTPSHNRDGTRVPGDVADRPERRQVGPGIDENSSPSTVNVTDLWHSRQFELGGHRRTVRTWVSAGTVALRDVERLAARQCTMRNADIGNRSDGA